MAKKRSDEKIEKTIAAIKDFQDKNEKLYKKSLWRSIDPYFDRRFSKEAEDLLAAQKEMYKLKREAKEAKSGEEFAAMMKRMTPEGGSNTVTGKKERKFSGGVFKGDGKVFRGKTRGRFT